MSIGVPIKLLHEAQNHVVTIELKTGEIYRGNLAAVEDNMNSQLQGVTVTSRVRVPTNAARDGRTSQMDYVYIRGSHIRFFIVPDMLKHAPMFKKAGKSKGVGMSRGRATVQRAQQKRGGGPGGRGGGPGGRGGRGGAGRP